MTPLQAALTRKPGELGPVHEALARLVISNPEGITRQQGIQRLNLKGSDPDRELRDLVAEIVRSGWLPIIADRGASNRVEGRYRIARVTEVDALKREALEHHSRAMKSHLRSRGLVDAFQAHHHLGALLLADVPTIPDLEAVT